MGDYGLLTAAIALTILAALTDIAQRVIHPLETLRCALAGTQVCVHWDGRF